jgi:hypothetical protein
MEMGAVNFSFRHVSPLEVMERLRRTGDRMKEALQIAACRFVTESVKRNASTIRRFEETREAGAQMCISPSAP